jgi:hypothetical protein
MTSIRHIHCLADSRRSQRIRASTVLAPNPPMSRSSTGELRVPEIRIVFLKVQGAADGRAIVAAHQRFHELSLILLSLDVVRQIQCIQLIIRDLANEGRDSKWRSKPIAVGVAPFAKNWPELARQPQRWDPSLRPRMRLPQIALASAIFAPPTNAMSRKSHFSRGLTLTPLVRCA